MQIGRTSGGRFWANRFRVLLTAAACVLRERLLALGVHVVVSVRRMVVCLPTATSDGEAWRRIDVALGARGLTPAPIYRQSARGSTPAMVRPPAELSL